MEFEGPYFDDEDNIPYGIEDADAVQLHRTDDPNVWGLLDVVRGRTPDYPVTVYMVAGDSVSGVVGLLLPDNTFISKLRSGVGREYRLQDGGADDGQLMPALRTLPAERPYLNAPVPTEFIGVVAWDGARPEDEILVLDEDTQLSELRRGRSRGLLLGSYQTKALPTSVRETHGQPNMHQDGSYHKPMGWRSAQAA